MLIIICILIILSIYLFLIYPSPKKLNKTMLVAHRGLHDIKKGIPENSLRAYENAIKHGYDIEIDIHLTKDNRIAVFHDDSLKRVCGKDILIENMTFTELQNYNLFDTYEKIPSLEDVLNTVNGKVCLVIEFKCLSLNCKRLCECANSILKNYNGEYIIQSFNPMVLNWYKTRRPDILRGQLSTAFLRQKDNSITKTLIGWLVLNFLARPNFISFEIRYTNALQRRICSFLGAINAGWTFSNDTEFKKYKKHYDIIIFEGFEP